jgi:hypothetical protein
VIYSRRNMLCGVCGERLPDELLFSARERAQVEQDLAEIKQREQSAKAVVKADTTGLSERWRRRHPVLTSIIRFCQSLMQRE